MVKINDIDKEINNNYEEQKNENGMNPEMERGYFNNTIHFDRKVFRKKPDLNFAITHDPNVQSSENPDKLKEIEKMKKNPSYYAKTSNNGFFNTKNRINGNNMTQYKNNPNLSNFNQNQKINNTNNYGGNIGDAKKLNIDGNNGADNRYSDNYKMNRVSSGFGPKKNKMKKNWIIS